MNHPLRSAPALACAALAALATLALPACRGDRSEQRPRQFLPDMDDQPKLLPQSKSFFFHDYVDEEGNLYGRAQRQPVDGAVAFSRALYANWRYHPGEDITLDGVDFARRDELLATDDAYFLGIRTDDAGNPLTDDKGLPLYVERMPVNIDEDLIALGRETYNIYCLPCHGGTGMGDGLVGVRWSYALPRFTDPLYLPGGEKADDGYIFHTIRNGVPNAPGATPPLKMPSYARKVTIEETWAIVAYVRTLQAAGNADINWIEDPDLRRELQARRRNLEGGS